MTLQVLWQHDCPGHIETEVVEGVIQVTCYVEEAPEPQVPRVTEGLQVLYTFEEAGGTVIHDVVGTSPPLNLTVASEAAVGWLPGGGLSVDSSTMIVSDREATQLVKAAKASNELTLEAWVRPSNTTQDGPARIMTLSTDFHHRNFYVAQARDLIDVRLRTTTTTDNGRPSLPTPSGSLSADLTHIVYTRDPSGAARIYVNGVSVADKVVGGDLSNWDRDYFLALANEPIGSRGWLGEYHLVGIYNRALTADEVIQNFQAGSRSPSA